MTKTKTKVKLCSICNGPIDIQANGWAGGHNAKPVNNGRCCSDCNYMQVLPARIEAIKMDKPW